MQLDYVFIFSNATVGLTNSSLDVPPDMAAWAVFHSGVADALSIEPDEVRGLVFMILSETIFTLPC